MKLIFLFGFGWDSKRSKCIEIQSMWMWTKMACFTFYNINICVLNWKMFHFFLTLAGMGFLLLLLLLLWSSCCIGFFGFIFIFNFYWPYIVFASLEYQCITFFRCVQSFGKQSETKRYCNAIFYIYTFHIHSDARSVPCVYLHFVKIKKCIGYGIYILIQ